MKLAIAVIVIILVGLTANIGYRWWADQREWFALQSQQLATIKSLEAFPPAGWDPDVWKNALTDPYNVWGNVTYMPSYSNISNDEMRSLLNELERIVAQTTTENSFDSVDQVFELLLKRGRKTVFITGYRDEFRDFAQRTRQPAAALAQE